MSEVSAAAATATGCTETRVAAAVAVVSYFGNKCAALVARS